MHCSKASLFDHLICTGEQAIGHGEAQRFRGLEIDNEFVLRWRLHRQVGRILALEDAIDVSCRAAVLVDPIRPERHQAAAGDEVAPAVDRGQSVLGRQLDDHITMHPLRRRARTIKPPFAGRASAVMACSISPASRTLIGRTSTPSDGAKACIAPNWPGPAATAKVCRNATRFTPGTISLSSSNHLAPMPYSYSMKPVALRSEEHTSELQSQSNLVCR